MKQRSLDQKSVLNNNAQELREFLSQVISIRSWSHFVNTCKLLSDGKSRWVFRGQGDSLWPLATSFEREAQKNRHLPEHWSKIEQAVLQEFKRSAHHYITSTPDPQNHLQWLAMIQHYGGPTRLLDFTRSPYIAGFHALAGIVGPKFSVWAINRQKIENVIISLGAALRKVRPRPADFPAGTMSKFQYRSMQAEELFNYCLDRYEIGSNPIPLIIPVEPSVLNERIAVQQGLFVAQARLTSPFEVELSHFLDMIANFESSRSSDDEKSKHDENVYSSKWRGRNVDRFIVARGAVVLKMEIPISLKPEFLEQLDYMNINMHSLFPGIEGYARQMKRTLEKWTSIEKEIMSHYSILVGRQRAE